ncbi:unnamed protein product [Periconia digitata]|uniref:PH domain-containing protein n=1 Tax=Periconia digitata TaxID=1303443 RepID=A0A9W4XH08_9PLEO|nr:unnamed protein product [Periconia digitata]
MVDSTMENGMMGLDPEGYTASRLHHSTPEHLHVTSRRFFVGPIPEGWLKTHRRDWYKHHLHINYSSKSASFTSSSDRRTTKNRRLTGLDGPSSSALFQRSFPQPEDCDDDDDDAGLQNREARAESARGISNGDAAADTDAHARASSGLSISLPEGQVTHKQVVASPESDVFVDAESEPETSDDGEDGDEGLKVYTHQEEADAPLEEPAAPAPRPPARTQSSTKSFVTASSMPGVIEPSDSSSEEASERPDEEEINTADEGSSHQPTKDDQTKAPGAMVIETQPAEQAPGRFDPKVRLESKAPQARGILTKIRGLSENEGLSSEPSSPNDGAGESISRRRSNLRNLVKFDIPEDSKRATIHLRAKQAQMTVQRASTKLKRRKIKDGLVVKMERMLIRVDSTAGDIPEDFDENAAQKIESRVKDKWREYMVVCRHSSSDDAEFVLQMYKTRVIPEIESPDASKRAAYQIPLGRKISRVNLYSSLDKSVVVWMPSSRGTRIFIMQGRTSSNAVEWYTFLRNIMGWRRSSQLQVQVPDMSVSLNIADPFKSLEESQMEAQEASDSDNEEAIIKTMQEEQAVAERLIRTCLEQLGDAPEWADVLNSWTNNNRMGLAWKRYDRLEWIHGANERKMYGTIAMSKSHDLELRPKSHYPTTAVTRKKHKTLTEPVPIEGFLVRLTSQRGQAKRLGLMFHKQLYFSSHDEFLIFSRPTNATPPPPPKLRSMVSGRGRANTAGSGISAASLAENAPDTWEIDPYPVRDGQVEWLREGHTGTPESTRLHDEEAADEAARKATNLLNCDGYINLAHVLKVRKAKRGATAADANLDSGSDVDFDDIHDSDAGEDGLTSDLDLDRTFELVMRNGLIIRLQAADPPRRKLWTKHVRALSKYWKFRTQADIALLQTTRARNLSALNIDEEGEAHIGQFAKKWEVTQSYASPLLYNMCGIAACRSIHLSGTLYRKPRIHAPFTRCSVLLAAGTLLVFADTLRSSTGKPLDHIHHERVANLDLSKGCYVYSGLVTETDLLYQNQTFDNNKPGHHALPRIYLDDGGWTSSDEDVMTTFVVWYGKSKSWFRSSGYEEAHGAPPDPTNTSGNADHNGAGSNIATAATAGRKGEQPRKEGKRGKLKRVAKLGSTGRSLVFRARSRAERDHWVLAVRNEIERCCGIGGALGASCGVGGGIAGAVGDGEDVRIEG